MILKTAYDESIRSYSPASLMREEVFRQLWDAGRIRRIEFYGRLMDWHTRWTEQSRTLYHVNWYRWPSLTRSVTGLVRRVRTHRANAQVVVQDAA